MSIDKELEVLVRLFEDDDPVVVEAVNKRLISRGTEVLNELTSLFYAQKDEETQDAIGERIIILNAEFAFENLQRVLKAKHPDLVKGIFYASAMVCQDLDMDEYDQLLASLTADLHEEVAGKESAYEKIKAFNQVFYHRLKFTTRTYSLKNKKTTFLISVLKNRHGSELPFSLVYYLLARVVGLDVYPMVFPGGLVPCYSVTEKPLFYIDIIRGGEVFSRQMLMKFLENKGIDTKVSEFKVDDDRVLIRIYLEVLYVAYASDNSFVREILNRAIKLFGDEKLLR